MEVGISPKALVIYKISHAASKRPINIFGIRLTYQDCYMGSPAIFLENTRALLLLKAYEYKWIKYAHGENY